MAVETVLGIRGRDFVLLATDTMQCKSLIYLKDDHNKVHELSQNSVMSIVGDGGDSLQISDFITKNLQLYKVLHGYCLSPESSAFFTRRTLSNYMKKHVRFRVNVLIAGYDAKIGPELYYIDSIGNAQTIQYGGHGSGHAICSSILQTHWKPEMNRCQGYDVLKNCVGEIHKRLVVNLRNFDVTMIDKHGVRRMLPINPANLVPPMTRKRRWWIQD